MPSDQASLLRTAMTVNSIYTLVCGIPLLAAAGSVAGMVGLTQTMPVYILGVVLVGVGAALGLVSRMLPKAKALAMLLTVGDVGYVLASFGFLLAMPDAINGTGKMLVGVVAALVAVLVAAQFMGLRRMSQA